MKKVLLIFSLSLVYITAHSQNEEDYSKIVAIITTSYNTSDSTLIAKHYNQDIKDTIKAKQKEAFVTEDAPEYFALDKDNNGKIIATELIMNTTDSNVYYVQFEQQDAKILTVALSEEKEITALQLEDY